jgi:predicted dehydrogenase
LSKLKVGVVGCGFVAQKRHLPSFLRLKETVSIRGVCDLNQGLATETAKKFGIPQAYSDISEMLSKKDLDIVDICTPPQTHASVAIEAMESGCNVLMEKPMALDVFDCDRMIHVAEKCGVKLSVIHNQRFYPPFLKAEGLVNSGAIGELTGMRVLSLTPREEYMAHENHWIHKLPGGVIGETGPHVVYMSLAFVKNVKSVDVCAGKKSDYPWVLYDNYRIWLEGENINSSIYVSHASDYTASEVDLFGTELALKIDLQSMLLVRYKRNHLKHIDAALCSLSTAGQVVKGVTSNVFKTMFRRPMLGHDIIIEKFIKSVINDGLVPVTPEEGRETVRVLEMIVKKLIPTNLNP